MNRPPKSLALFLFLLLSLRPPALLAEPVEVGDASGRPYFQKALELIQSTKQEIFLVMYRIQYDPKDPDTQPARLLRTYERMRSRGE